jgi:biotin transport system substrate-specific component
MKQTKTLNLTFCALFAALTAVFSQLVIPIQPVPINLATLSVLIAGGVLGAKYGTVSQAVFVLMGAVGLPVYAQFSGGIGILAGPTGGYLAGYIAAAFTVGFLCDRFGRSAPVLVLSMVLGSVFCYALGTAWFVWVSKMDFMKALGLCVFPFLIGDALKIAAATVVVPQLRRLWTHAVSGQPA